MKSFLPALSDNGKSIFFEFSVCSSGIWPECSQVEFKHLPSGEKRFSACFLSVHRFTRNKLIEMRKEDKEASENKLAQYQYPFPFPPPPPSPSLTRRIITSIIHIFTKFLKIESILERIFPSILISRRKFATSAFGRSRRRDETNKNVGIKFIEIVRQRFLAASIGYHLSVSLSRLEVYLVETNGSTTKDFIQKRNLVEKPVTTATGSETWWRMLKAPRSLTPARLHNCNAISGSCFLPSLLPRRETRLLA